MQRVKTYVESVKARVKQKALDQLSPQNADRVRTIENIQKHQPNLHSHTGVVDKVALAAKVAKQVPEPHTHMVGQVLGAATSAVQKGRVALDLMNDETRSQAKPLISTSEKRATTARGGSSTYGTF